MHRILVIFAALWLMAGLLFAGVAGAAEHFVAPNGTPSGDGSSKNPWDLQTALNQPPSVQPGDTIWVLGGTYKAAIHDGFIGKLKGNAASPITVRNYKGERATIDGQQDAFGLDVTGSYTWYWGLEIMSSCTTRVTATPVSPFGVGVYGPGNKFINLVVHDTLQGFSGYNAAPDTEYYGNLSYYNGIVSPDRNHGHGMYFQNISGAKTVSDNIVGDNADEGIQIYGSGNASLINFAITGNTIYNSGSWPTPKYQYNMIIAGGQTRKNIRVESNYSYYPPEGNAGGFAGQFGQYTPGQDMVVINNVLANGYMPLNFTAQAGAITFTGNTIVAGTDALRAVTVNLNAGQTLALYTWDRNTYYDKSPWHFYRGIAVDDSGSFSGANETFPSWQERTSFDAHSAYHPAAPTGLWVYIRPNKYESKRANITIFNWDSLPAASVDLSGVLSPGDRYVIQDAENFYGPPVERGVYSGKPVAVHMKGLTKAVPVGFATPAHTAPYFGVFVVLPGPSTTAISRPTPGH